MVISLELILDELGFDAEKHIPAEVNPKFKTAELFVPGQSQRSSDNLLVCTLSEAVAADRHSGTYFLCVRGDAAFDSPPTAYSDEASLEGITIINGGVGLRELYNRVHRVFVKIAEWIMDMERSAANHGGLQDLLDLSEPVFGNFITIQDSTFKLIAYTKNIDPPSVVMSRLVQHGFQPPETMELFRRYRRLEQYKTITDIIVSRDRITSRDFDVVKKTFHLGGSMFIIVVMECCKKPADTATVELFGILIEYIKAYADIDIAQTGGVAGIKALLLDILNRNTGGKEEARVRSMYCGYPFEGGFRLYAFSLEDEDNAPIAWYIQHLTDSCRDSVAFYRSRYILMVGFKRAGITETCDSAAKILAGADFTCGISDDFDNLWELTEAYEQAVIAVKTIKQLKLASLDTTSGRFRLFSESIIHYIVNAGRTAAPDVFSSSLLARSIAALREYDTQHHTDTAKILRMFLENERNATAVASLMHMHRNTVLYHMEKISSLLGVSLDDPDIRLQLILAFKTDDLILE